MGFAFEFLSFFNTSKWFLSLSLFFQFVSNVICFVLFFFFNYFITRPSFICLFLLFLSSLFFFIHV